MIWLGLTFVIASLKYNKIYLKEKILMKIEEIARNIMLE